MKNRFESILLGGAMLFGGLAHKRAGDVDARVSELAEEVESVRAEQAETPPLVPGMPLPTGYGLQVRGPHEEAIVVPVCLPPGFELDSMMLVPEFLPKPARDREEAPAPAQIVEELPAKPKKPKPAAPAAAEPEAEKIGGTMQYVYAIEPYSHQIDLEPMPLPEQEPAPVVDLAPRRERRAEAH
jgi:hypothetical protein